MPCYDSREVADHYREESEVSDMKARKLKKELDKVEAMLCGIMSALLNMNTLTTVYQWVDTKETGITIEQYRNWFDEHLKKDKERLAKEQEILG